MRRGTISSCLIRDRSFEQQRYRASGLNLVNAADAVDNPQVAVVLKINAMKHLF
jgi:hypothetical protein